MTRASGCRLCNLASGTRILSQASASVEEGGMYTVMMMVDDNSHAAVLPRASQESVVAWRVKQIDRYKETPN